MSMFEEVDAKLEAGILAKADKPASRRKGPDYSVRTVTHWFTFQHKTGFCNVPTHYDNVPDTDFKGEKYDKYPVRAVVDIDDYTVCRWCYVAEADLAALIEGIPPVEVPNGDN